MSEFYDIEELTDGTFPLHFKFIDRHHLKYPILMERLNSVEYVKGSFRGGRNTINFATFNDKIVIPQLLQRYVVKWYHMYLLHKLLDRTEAMIFKHLYWPGIRKIICEEVTKCDVCQRTKRSTEK